MQNLLKSDYGQLSEVEVTYEVSDFIRQLYLAQLKNL